jgi:hypothetical protein
VNLNIDVGFSVRVRKAFINLLDEAHEVQASIPLADLIGKRIDKTLLRIETEKLMLSTGRYSINCYIDTESNGLLVNAMDSDWITIESEFEQLYSKNLICATCHQVDNATA